MRSSFRALRHHPDKGGDPDVFKEITHAFVICYIIYFPRLIYYYYIVMKFSPMLKSEAFMTLVVKLVYRIPEV